MPLRLHVGERYWTLLENRRRSEKIWTSGVVYRRDPETNTWYRRDFSDPEDDWTETDARSPFAQDE